jgi:lysophospholipase L1-like esterase
MPRGLIAALAATALLALAAGAPAAAARTRYYVSLGDSLAQGMQPQSGGITANTSEGYADQLHALERSRLRGLRLLKLGCGGETTTSFLTGRGNSLSLLLGCNPAGGSQMAAAERFLRAHRRRGQVAFLTLDIGANDVVGCASGASFDIGCVTRGVQRIDANLPRILRRLRRAGAGGVPMAAMTLYDPFLQLYLTPEDQSQALLINAYAKNLNRALERLYRAAGFRVAHVDKAFRTYDTSATTTLAGQPQPVPVAVAEICRLTWMCAPAPFGPNIHANRSGYAVIAGAFAAALGPLR